MTVEEELENSLQEQLDSIDFSAVEDVLDDLDDESKQIFKSTSFWEKVQQILSGNFEDGFSYFFQE